jgi:DNA-binding beta-propeller fold protein YncE
VTAGTLAHAEPDLYIAVNSTNEVLVIDTQTDTLRKKIGGAVSPHGLTLAQDGRSLVVGSSSKEKDAGGHAMSQLTILSTLDGKTKAVIPMMNWSHDQISTPDGRYVISTHPNEGRACVTDLVKRKIISTLDIGKTANHVVLSRDGRHAYVSSGGTDSIIEIDTNDWSITRRLAGGPTPGQMVMSQDGKLLYVASFRSDELSVISVEFGTVVQTRHLGKGMHGIDMDTDGRLYISGGDDNRLYVVTPGVAAVRRITLPGEPYWVKAVAGTGKIYVSAHDAPKLWVIDRNTLTLSKTINLTGIGHHMAVSGGARIGVGP